jgi:hypothetical protein
MKERTYVKSVTQGVADGFIQGTIDLLRTTKFWIKDIEYAISRPDLISADGKSVEASISTKSLSALNFTDECVKWFDQQSGGFQGGLMRHKIKNPIQSKYLYFQLDSTGTGVALVGTLRITILISESMRLIK